MAHRVRWLWLFLCLAIIKRCYSRVQLDIRLSTSCSDCEADVIFCVQEQNNVHGMECTYGYQEFHYSNPPSTDSGAMRLPNPVSFTVNSTIPFDVRVEIKTNGGSFEHTLPIANKDGSGILLMMPAIYYAFNASCAMSYYGENCSTFCVGANNDAQGHYTCDDNGGVVCLEGYVNWPSSSNRCSRCIMNCPTESDDFTGTTTETMMVSKGTINKNTVPSSSNMQDDFAGTTPEMMVVSKGTTSKNTVLSSNRQGILSDGQVAGLVVAALVVVALAVAGVIGGSLLVKNRPWARDAMILSPRTKSTSKSLNNPIYEGNDFSWEKQESQQNNNSSWTGGREVDESDPLYSSLHNEIEDGSPDNQDAAAVSGNHASVIDPHLHPVAAQVVDISTHASSGGKPAENLYDSLVDTSARKEIATTSNQAERVGDAPGGGNASKTVPQFDEVYEAVMVRTNQ